MTQDQGNRQVRTQTTKLAWIHDGPTGVASLGHFNCVCGNRISEVAYGGPAVTCTGCGRTWDGRGWLVSDPVLVTIPQGAGLLGWPAKKAQS